MDKDIICDYENLYKAIKKLKQAKASMEAVLNFRR